MSLESDVLNVSQRKSLNRQVRLINYINLVIR